MKFKPLYIYLIAFVAFLFAVIIFSGNRKNDPDSASMSEQMPQDDVHSGISKDEQMPSKSNVVPSAMQKMEDLKLAFEKNPNDTLKIRQYADMLTMAHQSSKAVELYEKILNVDPNRIDVLLQLTFIKFNDGDLEKAEEYTYRILKIDNNHQIGKYNLGAIAAAKGDNKKAKSIWEGLVKQFPKTDIAHIAKESLKQIAKINQ